MPSSEFIQEWAWLIAIALSFGLVGLLFGLRRLQAYQAHKRALAEAEDSSDAHANFLRARRNFLLLIAVFVVLLLAIEVWNLYFYLER